jgi:type IV secretory pathway VirB4 component
VQAALHAVQQERLGLHQVTLGIIVEGRNPDELAERLAMIEANATRNQIALRRPFMHQADVLALFTTRPAPDTISAAARNMLSQGVGLLSPFGYEVPKDTKGSLAAINRATGSPLWLDKFSLPAYNEITLGRTGSGKTFCAGLRAYRDAGMFGIQTIFIDPQGNFEKVTAAVGGKYNRLRLGEGTALNILDVVHDHPAAQVSHVVVMLETILGRPLTIREKAAVDRCLLELYHDAGVEVDNFHAERMPLLEDLVLRLEGRGGSMFDLGAPDLARDLGRFVSGSLAGVFNAHTTLSLNLDRRHKIVTFDVSDLEGEFQPAFIYALLSSIERVIRNRRHEQAPTNVVIDEFGILSSIPALAEAAGMLAKRVRAWKVGIQCLDQNWDTFDTPAGRRILENSIVKVIMRVDETAAPAIISNLGLTGHHAEVILTAGVGEGIMLVGSKPYHVFFQASPAEIEMLTPYTQRAVETVTLPTRR